MIKVTTLTAAALLLGAGYGMAADTSTGQPAQNSPATTSPVNPGQNSPATMTPSSSGRPSAILNDSACQDLWKSALNDMSGTSRKAAVPSSNNTPDMGGVGDKTGTSGSMEESSDKMAPTGEKVGSSGSIGPASDMANGESLAFDRAQPYITNFAMVDKNNDRQISQAEFQEGCKNGWIQAVTNSRNSQSSNPSQDSTSSKTGG